MSAPKLVLGRVESRMFAENAYIAQFEGRDDCLIIDPGFDPELIEQYVTQHRLTPRVILNTHGHADHIAGNQALKRCWPDCPLVIGHLDADKLTDPMQNLSGQFGMGIVSPPADQTVQGGQQVQWAGFELEVRDTPGHSRGHVVFICRQTEPWVVFGGDVLFQGSIGRTDFPDGSFEQLRDAIHQHLFTLPDETIVYPGHGDPTTIGVEKATNPFVGLG